MGGGSIWGVDFEDLNDLDVGEEEIDPFLV